ncbi:MAG: MOSC domain-containing protein [Anaerolineae bacterium]|nr:MOSC domain-containing protein [Anaerolineae bacterium]
MSEIISIVYKPETLPQRPKDHYTRVPLEQAQLIVGHGIEGDKKGGHPMRQLNIMTAEGVDELAGRGFKVQPGELGEQIIVRGFDVNVLEVGDQLRLGAEAVIEVTEKRNGCGRFQSLQGKHPSEAKGFLGIMAKVIDGGLIQLGDEVSRV